MNNILAFDCGATSGRAVLATFEDGAFRTEEVYRFPSEMVERDGRLYWMSGPYTAISWPAWMRWKPKASGWIPSA